MLCCGYMKAQIKQYPAVFVPEKEGGYSVLFPTLPGCYTQGETFEEATKMAEEVLELWLSCADTAEIVDYGGHGEAIMQHIVAREVPKRRNKIRVGRRVKAYATA